MPRPKLSREQRDELGRWSIHIVPHGENDWWIYVYRDNRMQMGWGGCSMEKAVTGALRLDFRKDVSPLLDVAIPPSQVRLSISVKYMAKNPEFAKEVEKLLRVAVGD